MYIHMLTFNVLIQSNRNVILSEVIEYRYTLLEQIPTWEIKGSQINGVKRKCRRYHG